MVVVIKGAGDLASGIALRLFHAHVSVVMTEIAFPTALRRTVCFSEAVRQGKTLVEDVCAVLVQNESEMQQARSRHCIPIFVDPEALIVKRLAPDVVVDAIMAKRNMGTSIHDAGVVIGIGPGFSAGIDCHAVVETKRGHTIGRVITEGSAIPNTGIPGSIGGYTIERLLRAPAAGIFEPKAVIGDIVQKGDLVAVVSGIPIHAEIAGIVRGILPAGIPVTLGMKAGDIDPRCEKTHCFTVSDKALSVAGGVLEAILRFTRFSP